MVERGKFSVAFKRQVVEARKEDADLRDRIEEIVVEHPRYGYRRVTWQLRRQGWRVNHKRVARVMWEDSLQCQVNPVPRANACLGSGRQARGFGGLPFRIIASSPRTDVRGLRGTG